MLRPLLKTFAAVALITSTFGLWSQTFPPEQANEARIDKLLSQMTLEEKMNLIRGATEPSDTNQGQAGYLSGFPASASHRFAWLTALRDS